MPFWELLPVAFHLKLLTQITTGPYAPEEQERYAGAGPINYVASICACDGWSGKLAASPPYAVRRDPP